MSNKWGIQHKNSAHPKTCLTDWDGLPPFSCYEKILLPNPQLRCMFLYVHVFYHNNDISTYCRTPSSTIRYIHIYPTMNLSSMRLQNFMCSNVWKYQFKFVKSATGNRCLDLAGCCSHIDMLWQVSHKYAYVFLAWYACIHVRSIYLLSTEMLQKSLIIEDFGDMPRVAQHICIHMKPISVHDFCCFSVVFLLCVLFVWFCL